MKKIIFSLFLILAFVAGLSLVFPSTLFAQPTADNTGGIDIGGIHIGWGFLTAILGGVELVLRALPTGKFGTILGIISWLHRAIPNNQKKTTPQINF